MCVSLDQEYLGDSQISISLNDLVRFGFDLFQGEERKDKPETIEVKSISGIYYSGEDTKF